jgi:flavodoxin
LSETLSSDAEKPKTAIVIYDSRFGNTKIIAEALARGLEESEIETQCVDAKKADVSSLTKYDLICVGAPTEEFTASAAIRDFLALAEEGPDLGGIFGFAFDTKVPPGIFGSGARLIEKDLKRHLKLEIIAPHQTAIVDSIRKSGAIVGAELRDGEEKKFEEIGRNLGMMLRESSIPQKSIII